MISMDDFQIPGHAGVTKDVVPAEIGTLRGGSRENFSAMKRAEIEARTMVYSDSGISDVAWKKMRRKLDLNVRIRKAAAVAASLALIAGAYFLGGRRASSSLGFLANGISVETGPGQRSKLTLPDGTKVSLNECSSLSYNASEWKDGRNVNLTGQAVFDVVHMEDMPFTVTSGFLTVNDIGTSFEVSGYLDDEFHYVRLISGEASVEILDSEDPSILSPGLTLFLNTKTGESFIDKSSAISDTFDWQKGFIVFDNNTLSEKQLQLQRHFGYKFNISSDCSEFRYNAVFDNDSVNEVMEVIKEMTPSICYSVDRYTMTVKIWRKPE